MDLTTVARVKVFAEIGTTRYDEQLKRLVESISASVESELYRTTQQASRVEFINTETRLRRYTLRAWPVQSVASITYDTEGVHGPSAEVLSDPDDYQLVEGGLFGEIHLAFRPIEYPNTLRVTYTGGMAANTKDFMAAFPDLSQAVVEQVVFQHQSRNRLGLESASTGGSSVTVDATTGFLPSLMRTVQRHRRSV